MHRQGAPQIAITSLLFLAMTPAVLLFGAQKALSDEPGRIVLQEEPDRFANRPFLRDTTLERYVIGFPRMHGGLALRRARATANGVLSQRGPE
jgi:hypothetical protein